MNEWIWRWCERCEEDKLVLPDATRCPGFKCGSKFGERSNDPPPDSRDGQHVEEEKW